VVLRKAICMHEEDVGLLWKHVDYRTGHSESRRSRRLVISFLTTVVNYEYLVRVKVFMYCAFTVYTRMSLCLCALGGCCSRGKELAELARSRQQKHSEW
jgi:hypothetical protein